MICENKFTIALTKFLKCPQIRLTSHKVKMGKDEKIVDMIIDVNSLTNDKNVSSYCILLLL